MNPTATLEAEPQVAPAVGPEVRFAETVIDAVAATTAAVNSSSALRLRLIETLRVVEEGRYLAAVAAGRNPDRELSQRSLRAEVAATVLVSENAAGAMISLAQTLTADLPATFDAFDRGLVSSRHAQAIVDHLDGLTPELITELESAVLPRASQLTPTRFESLVRRTRERLDPQNLEERHDRAFEKRSVTEEPGRDGMSYLTIYGKAITNQAIMDRLTKAALALKKAGDPRTLAQLRADLLTQVMVESRESVLETPDPTRDDSEAVVAWFRGIVPTVMVTVPVLSLLDRETSTGIAELQGYGPISLRDAKVLAARAPSFVRLLTDPHSGVVLGVGRRRYKVPKHLRLWLQIRDGTCRFPGCGRLAKYCDLDHTREWHDGGSTDHDNLAAVCRSHHTVKGETDWQVEQSADGSGTLIWTSPNGREHTTRPATDLPF